MNKISSDQKLALVRSIRMQSDYNRNLCRERERFLYGYQPATTGEREIYGTEMNAALSRRPEEIINCPKEASAFGSFRLRFLVAVILIGIFIYMDQSQMTLFEMSMKEIAAYITTYISFDL